MRCGGCCRGAAYKGKCYFEQALKGCRLQIAHGLQGTPGPTG